MAGMLGTITNLISSCSKLLPSIRQNIPSSSPIESDNSRVVSDELNNLMRTVERIKATLCDAEEREIRDHSVKLWLDEIRKVAYAAEDLLSEYQYEFVCAEIAARDGSKRKLKHCGFGRLPESVCSLYNLQTLALYQCHKLVEIPEGIGNLVSLHFLLLSNCKIGILPESIGYLRNLKMFRILTCPLFELPETIGNFVQLEEFVLHECAIQNLCFLTRFEIYDCPSLQFLFAKPLVPLDLTEHFYEVLHFNSSIGLRNLTSLEDLKVHDCHVFELGEDELLPIVACKVEVSGCPKLRSWCQKNNFKYSSVHRLEGEDEDATSCFNIAEEICCRNGNRAGSEDTSIRDFGVGSLQNRISGDESNDEDEVNWDELV
ncbi:putative disease resistance RPP13-like protein 1 [Carex littledalei]|uniref:Putative disease resistance RPP13-like protein 1 n=1 Tax=Carex littledalei TaxID=544730 RepID=A0A833QY11_9POAL|nr:putative disease resistance RPP13-like protein 1 [Carex littledalei]